MRLKNIPALILLIQLLLGPFAPLAARAGAVGTAESEESMAEAVDERGGAAAKKGLQFRLSEGVEQSEREAPQANVARAEKLSEAETARVLARLPELKTEEGDRQEFALREGSLPAPRTGATVLQPFPAPEARETPDAAAGGELKVLRRSPEGEVPLAPQVSVTFSQPMVAVTSQEEAAKVQPARLTPQPPGRWRWLGTKTLIFDPSEQRLPMATEFEVSVPAGTRGANGGGATRAPLVWKFATPAPKLVVKYPETSPVRRDTLVFMQFDQRVEPEAVLRKVQVRAGASALGVRLAKDDEIAADENVKRLVGSATKGRWLALRVAGQGAGGELPPDTAVTVTVGPGTPSAEGPRTTTAAESFSFRTYGALRVTDHGCGYENRCTPFDGWRIEFSNPLDMEAFDRAQVKIEPDVPGAPVNVYGQNMYIGGTKRGRTTYRVTLDPRLRDQFGQTLGQSAPLTFNVGPAPPSLMSAGGNFVVLDPAGGPQLSVFSVNQPWLKVSLYAVEPNDFGRFISYMRYVSGYYEDVKRKQTTPPGTLVSSRTVTVKGQPDEMTETRLDLSPALKGRRTGNVFVVVEPGARRQPRGEREVLRTWAQLTGIGLDAFADGQELVGWATSLADGRPLEGLEMSLQPSAARAVTDREGLVRMPLPEKAATPTGMLVARRGDETAFLPEQSE